LLKLIELKEACEFYALKTQCDIDYLTLREKTSPSLDLFQYQHRTSPENPI
jgi:hypothetical protein